MAWKAVTTNAVDIKKTMNVPYEGTFMGCEQITTQLGPQFIWRFVDAQDQPFGIYGFTSLNRAMANLKQGSMCRITYKGTINAKTKYGMKNVHQALVEIEDAVAAEEDVKIPF